LTSGPRGPSSCVSVPVSKRRAVLVAVAGGAGAPVRSMAPAMRPETRRGQPTAAAGGPGCPLAPLGHIVTTTTVPHSTRRPSSRDTCQHPTGEARLGREPALRTAHRVGHIRRQPAAGFRPSDLRATSPPGMILARSGAVILPTPGRSGCGIKLWAEQNCCRRAAGSVDVTEGEALIAPPSDQLLRLPPEPSRDRWGRGVLADALGVES
jgi:hypothetical protein